MLLSCSLSPPPLGSSASGLQPLPAVLDCLVMRLPAPVSECLPGWLPAAPCSGAVGCSRDFVTGPSGLAASSSEPGCSDPPPRCLQGVAAASGCRLVCPFAQAPVADCLPGWPPSATCSGALGCSASAGSASISTAPGCCAPLPCCLLRWPAASDCPVERPAASALVADCLPSWLPAVFCPVALGCSGVSGSEGSPCSARAKPLMLLQKLHFIITDLCRLSWGHKRCLPEQYSCLTHGRQIWAQVVDVLDLHRIAAPSNPQLPPQRFPFAGLRTHDQQLNHHSIQNSSTVHQDPQNKCRRPLDHTLPRGVLAGTYVVNELGIVIFQ